jgi:hypothetical protein
MGGVERMNVVRHDGIHLLPPIQLGTLHFQRELLSLATNYYI